MHTCTAVIKRCRDAGLYIGYVPGFPRVHGQGETLEELNGNLREVISMILDSEAPAVVGDFVGKQIVVVA